MIVKELIEILSKYDPNAVVYRKDVVNKNYILVNQAWTLEFPEEIGIRNRVCIE